MVIGVAEIPFTINILNYIFTKSAESINIDKMEWCFSKYKEGEFQKNFDEKKINLMLNNVQSADDIAVLDWFFNKKQKDIIFKVYDTTINKIIKTAKENNNKILLNWIVNVDKHGIV